MHYIVFVFMTKLTSADQHDDEPGHIWEVIAGHKPQGIHMRLLSHQRYTNTSTVFIPTDNLKCIHKLNKPL